MSFIQEKVEQVSPDKKDSPELALFESISEEDREAIKADCAELAPILHKGGEQLVLDIREGIRFYLDHQKYYSSQRLVDQIEIVIGRGRSALLVCRLLEWYDPSMPTLLREHLKVDPLAADLIRRLYGSFGDTLQRMRQAKLRPQEWMAVRADIFFDSGKNQRVQLSLDRIDGAKFSLEFPVASFLEILADLVGTLASGLDSLSEMQMRALRSLEQEVTDWSKEMAESNLANKDSE